MLLCNNYTSKIKINNYNQIADGLFIKIIIFRVHFYFYLISHKFNKCIYYKILIKINSLFLVDKLLQIF